MNEELRILAELAESHLQSPGDFYLIIDMMRNIKITQQLIDRSSELKKF